MPKFSGFVTKTVVPILLPYKRKLLETHAIPKNCPIYFSMIKKMPLNILQQKLQIYTQTGSSRGQWSHWFVCFFLSISPPFKNCILTIASKQIIPLSCLFFFNPDLAWGLKSWHFTPTWPERQTQDYENRECDRNVGFLCAGRGAEEETKMKIKRGCFGA